MFITRVYSITTNSYYTTSFTIMQNKKEKIIKAFQKIHYNIKPYLDIGEEYTVEEIHTDFSTS